ncbi:MAG: fatty acid CoA ligase family protein [Agitococcus sp.]|nr:fatty acid CoA ligase family protein [Agitococcus sp.]
MMNVCTRIFAASQLHPERLALSIPNMEGLHFQGEENINYGELAERCAKMQYALNKIGLVTGDRILILARPHIQTYVLMLSLLSLGLVPVLIDRGMSRQRILASIAVSRAKITIGELSILRLWWLFPPLWKLPKYALDGQYLGVKDIRPLLAKFTEKPECLLLPATAHGLITFTSGSTGNPKGADRTHHSLIEQHLAIRAHWPDHDDDIDSPCFPVLVLHNLCCGISTIMPRVDLAAPAHVNVRQITNQWRTSGITRIAAAPAFMTQVCQYAQSTRQQFPAIRSLAIGGSTMPFDLVVNLDMIFPSAEIMLVYGSTEAEPIAEIFLPELRQHWQRYAGHLVGLPAVGTEVRIVDPNADLSDEAEVDKATVVGDDVGEILVAGKHVLHGYVDNASANKESKIPRSRGDVWHRTGDAGFLDSEGRLWLVGRIKDALLIDNERVYTFAPEKECDALAGVIRSALVQQQKQVILVLEATECPEHHQLLAILNKHGIPNAALVFVNKMPVDGRHNSKIDRSALVIGIAKKRWPMQILSSKIESWGIQ